MSIHPHTHKSEGMADTVMATINDEIRGNDRITGHHRGEHTVALAIMCLRETLLELYKHQKEAKA